MSSPSSPEVKTGLRQFLEQEGRERLILLLNHVLASEPVAQQRLQPHAGRRLRVAPDGWPRLLSMMVPPPAPLQVQVTPAGLLELCPMLEYETESIAPELDVVVDTHDPLGLVARVLAGGTPQLQLAGDAQFAADVNWLADNLRWDVAADVERLFGPVPAERLRIWGLAVARALRDAAARLASRAGAPSPGGPF
jgi:ubiquinone biosynthesis protein UbiJ